MALGYSQASGPDTIEFLRVLFLTVPIILMGKDTRPIVSYSLLGVGAIATILGTYWILGSGAAQSAFRAEFSQGGAQFSGHWQF